MIDFHTHILPGMDDGSKDTETSRIMMELSKIQNVETMIATPHFYARRESLSSFLERREEAKERLMSVHNPNKHPEIILGAEVTYFDGISQSSGLEALCIEGTNLIMIEMPFAQWTDRNLKDIKALINIRKMPVILAHVERYIPITGKSDVFKEMIKLPVILQFNAESFCKWLEGRRIIKILKEKDQCVLGSDCHGVSKRVPNMAEGCEALGRKMGQNFLTKTETYSKSLLEKGGKDEG